MAIRKLPFVPDEYLKPLKQWLELERHAYLAEHHSYAACGNDSESLRAKHYASCMTYILMMTEYHLEGAVTTE